MDGIVSSPFSDGSGSLSLFSDVTTQTFDSMNLVDTISTEIQFLFSVNAATVRTKYTQVLKFQNEVAIRYIQNYTWF